MSNIHALLSGLCPNCKTYRMVAGDVGECWVCYTVKHGTGHDYHADQMRRDQNRRATEYTGYPIWNEEAEAEWDGVDERIYG